MSVRILNFFVNSLRQTLPKCSKSGVQLRFLSAMDAAVPEVMETEKTVRNKKSTRYRRRQWEDAAPDKEVGVSGAKRQRQSDKPTERIKRRKMAVLMGYCGTDYFGMQRNPGVKTIEEDLLKAMLEAKYITDADFKNQQNAHFQRSSRTDKKVSAARQVVSMKLPPEINLDEVNLKLPECIRVFGFRRVANRFNAKYQCNGRTYSYTLPTYVFEPSLISLEERKQYRITPDKIEYVNKLLEVYVGTRSFHNFTEKKHHQDPSALRYMMSFTLEKVFVESDMEFANLCVKGQSFMLHQIRKMVGLIIAIAQGHVELSIMDKVFEPNKVMIPTAPALGLVLDMIHFDNYNSKYKSSSNMLTWEREEEKVENFRRSSIYPAIVKGEVEENSMGTWLATKLVKHSYDRVEDTPYEKPVEEAKEIVDDKEDDYDTPMGDDDDDDDEAKLEICEDFDFIEVLSNTSSSSDSASKDAGKNDSPKDGGGSSSGDLSTIVLSEDSSPNLEIVTTDNSNSENSMAATNKDEDKTDQIVQVPNEASEPVIVQFSNEALESVLVQDPNEALESVLEQDPNEALESVLEQDPNEALESVLEQDPNEALESVLEQGPNEALESVLEQDPNEALESVLGQVPNEALESVLVQVPDEALESVLVQVPDEALESVLVQVPNEASESVLVQVPYEASESVLLQVRNEASESVLVQVPNEASESVLVQVPNEASDTVGQNGQLPKVDDQNVQSSSADGQNDQPGSVDGENSDSGTSNGQAPSADAKN